ncbi:MAG: type II toxin-antitoxin system RelE family toxin [Thermodesulfovibrionales bacterium]
MGKAQYLVDESGQKTAVVLPVEEYEELLEDVHDLAVIAERKDEPAISLDELKKRLKANASYYEIRWKHFAEKDLKRIDRQYIPRSLEAVESLSNNPFLSQHRKLCGSESSYRIRIGEYRVVWTEPL